MSIQFENIMENGAFAPKEQMLHFLYFQIQRKLFIITLFITAKFFITSFMFAQMFQFSINLNSLQQKISLTLNLGTNAVAV